MELSPQDLERKREELIRLMIELIQSDQRAVLWIDAAFRQASREVYTFNRQQENAS